MYPHHEASIQNAVAYFQNDPTVEGLILGGSLAHGFAGPSSDVDVMIIIADQEYEQRLQDGRLHFYNRQLCTYPEGYVDGKYLGTDHLKKVQKQGSEPARFAFLDARVLFSRNDALFDTVQRIGRYPKEGKDDRLNRFYAQLEGWYWYAFEALKQNDRYLLGVAISKLILFGGRLILTHNEVLYPYHKWFLKVLEQVPDKPIGLLSSIHQLCEEPTQETIKQFFEKVKGFRVWSISAAQWPNQFIIDSELNWLQGVTPIDDL